MVVAWSSKCHPEGPWLPSLLDGHTPFSWSPASRSTTLTPSTLSAANSYARAPPLSRECCCGKRATVARSSSPSLSCSLRSLSLGREEVALAKPWKCPPPPHLFLQQTSKGGIVPGKDYHAPSIPSTFSHVHPGTKVLPPSPSQAPIGGYSSSLPSQEPAKDELGPFWELLDNDLKPFMPMENVPLSQQIFQQHKELAHQFLVAQENIVYLEQKKNDLLTHLNKHDNNHKSCQQRYNEKIIQLQNKNEGLRRDHRRLSHQLAEIKRRRQASSQTPHQQHREPHLQPHSHPQSQIPPHNLHPHSQHMPHIYQPNLSSPTHYMYTAPHRQPPTYSPRQPYSHPPQLHRPSSQPNPHPQMQPYSYPPCPQPPNSQLNTHSHSHSQPPHLHSHHPHPSCPQQQSVYPNIQKP